MKKLINIFLIFSATIIGCEAPIDLELNNSETGVIVIEALLRNVNKKDFVKITKTTSFYNNEGEDFVSGASVVLEGNGTSYNLIESSHPDSLGYYIKPNNLSFNNGETYTLTVIAEGETYTATSTMNYLPGIDSMEIYYDDIQFIFASEAFQIAPEDTSYNIELTYQEDGELGDGYLFKYYVNDSLASVNPRDFVFFDDEFLIEGPVTGAAQSFTKAVAQYGDTITIEMLSIHPDFITFYEVLFNQTDLSGNLFASSPPANVPTNFSNGARGFFQVADVNYKTKIFKPLYKE